jgi:hypothetical protein
LKKTPNVVGVVLRHCAVKGWAPLCIAVVSFFAGVFSTARMTHPKEVKADSHHVFELMIYHTVPGKVPALESVFRGVSKLQTKYGLNVIGYWVPNENDPAWKNTFVYLVVHPNREAAEANWRALHADPAFQPYFKAAVPLIEQINGDYKVDEIYMRPTDYSGMK